MQYTDSDDKLKIRRRMFEYKKGLNKFYFGYGANREPQMMEAIIGRVPEGHSGRVTGFELCIQGWSDLSENIRNILSTSWDDDFRSYVIRPSNNSSDVVKGRFWRVSTEELRLLDNWEMTNVWHDVLAVSMCVKGKCPTIAVQFVHDRNMKLETVNGKRYETHLNSPAKMYKVARTCRNEFYERK